MEPRNPGLHLILESSLGVGSARVGRPSPRSTEHGGLFRHLAHSCISYWFLADILPFHAIATV